MGSIADGLLKGLGLRESCPKGESVNKQISLRISSISLCLFGLFEIMGILMLIAPKEYMPAGFESQPVFWSVLSGIYGISRIIAGIAIWKNRKWGSIFGLMLCLTTMIVAPTIVPFGIMDLVFSVLITIAILSARYGNEKWLEG
jgi:hypothetical protein